MKAEHSSFRTAVGFEAKSYHYFMRSHMFPRIARLLGLLTWNKDYHSLESIFYEERAMDQFGNHTSYVKWVSVALEHERNAAKTAERISKLQLFNVPLKVLITYAADGPETDALLRACEVVIADADIFQDSASLRKQLVVVGTPKTMNDWRFYVFESGGFVLMLPNPPSDS